MESSMDDHEMESTQSPPDAMVLLTNPDVFSRVMTALFVGVVPPPPDPPPPNPENGPATTSPFDVRYRASFSTYAPSTFPDRISSSPA